MAKELFLINPYRLSRKRRVRGGTKRRRGSLPGRLLSRMMRTYGPGRGMREAWSAYRRGVRRNDPDLSFSNPRSRGRRKRRRLNPFGEEVMIVGANPRRKSRKVRARRRRARPRRSRFSLRGLLGRIGLGRRRRRRSLAANPRRRRYRRRRAMYYDNPRRRRRSYRRRRAMYFDNPRRRRYRRRFRDNPRRKRRGGRAVSAALPAFSFRRPLSLLMPAAIGTAAYLATEKVPGMVNVTANLPRIGVKAAVGFGGGILIGKFLGRTNGAVWVIGSVINTFTDVLRTYIFKTPGLLGYGAFPYQEQQVNYAGLGGYDGLEAYPTEAGYPM